MMVYRLLAVLGEGPVGPARPPSPTLFLDQTEIFLRPSPPPLSHGLDAPPPASYLKVWICHCRYKKRQK